MDVSGFLSWLRDAFTLAVFVMIGLFCVFHDFREKFGFLFDDEPVDRPRTVKQVKFNGSASTWVK